MTGATPFVYSQAREIEKGSDQMNWTFYKSKDRYKDGAREMWAATGHLDSYGSFPVKLYFDDNSSRWSTSSYAALSQGWERAEAPAHRQAPS